MPLAVLGLLLLLYRDSPSANFLAHIHLGNFDHHKVALVPNTLIATALSVIAADLFQHLEVTCIERKIPKAQWYAGVAIFFGL